MAWRPEPRFSVATTPSCRIPPSASGILVLVERNALTAPIHVFSGGHSRVAKRASALHGIPLTTTASSACAGRRRQPATRRSTISRPSRAVHRQTSAFDRIGGTTRFPYFTTALNKRSKYGADVPAVQETVAGQTITITAGNQYGLERPTMSRWHERLADVHCDWCDRFDTGPGLHDLRVVSAGRPGATNYCLHEEGNATLVLGNTNNSLGGNQLDHRYNRRLSRGGSDARWAMHRMSSPTSNVTATRKVPRHWDFRHDQDFSLSIRRRTPST